MLLMTTQAYFHLRRENDDDDNKSDENDDDDNKSDDNDDDDNKSDDNDDDAEVFWELAQTWRELELESTTVFKNFAWNAEPA